MNTTGLHKITALKYLSIENVTELQMNSQPFRNISDEIGYSGDTFHFEEQLQCMQKTDSRNKNDQNLTLSFCTVPLS